ncbi:D-alanyl-D-alanine carboxypeptidase/D-alanyl-D-alanine-endopeptidase [Allomuricauda sp. ARW1Y1]|uniref:D-alanyl-D-alanine carboxypeptidase/D-alanyl-D-alanine-endopeptidase n=1 Tax=Allomuricauda sp. ARW1Y1 TaxID=2663843 RepID=UPI0015CDE183|nr:D-alanyl-D-alanine carboxypeptidase [Muricauda sp. ARW1Y1]NYJ27271.1 D-alanyl-D-alanine carboxypeptidase/D-alanyl-D-alanine-endopeptidase (penicillin-binding protein 4) [Muricauda sp. ARW1Y1]
MRKPNRKPLIFLIFKALTLAFLVTGCSSLKRTLNQQMDHASFQHSLRGLVVVDANTGEEIYTVNGDIYFTPASNTKIVTFYTGLQLLPKNIPSFRYVVANDTVFFEGSGDPTWLHPFFKDSTAIRWLQKQGNLALFTKNHQEDRYGPGWAWEDYDTYFSPEKSTLPLYGNVVTVFNNEGLEVSPANFKNHITLKDTTIHREEFHNRFYISPTEQDTLEIPFMTSDTLTKELLESALGRKITLSDHFPEGKKQVIYGVETDSIYKRMLFASDNFLAEQLLLAASAMVSDTLSTQKAIDYMLDNDLKDLAQQPRWVDGSGLSRYNLFTPRSFVHILQKMHNQLPEERLFAIFPMWGPDHTVEKWEDPTTEPFLFAKSGSVGNNYNLSGYIKTKSGKLLIFSFMNNHFRVPSQVIREQMYTTLKHLYFNY